MHRFSCSALNLKSKTLYATHKTRRLRRGELVLDTCGRHICVRHRRGELLKLFSLELTLTVEWQHCCKVLVPVMPDAPYTVERRNSGKKPYQRVSLSPPFVQRLHCSPSLPFHFSPLHFSKSR